MIARRHLLIVCTFLLSVLLYVDRTCISTAKDAVCADLGLSKEQWSWVLASFAFGYALFQTPGGAMADRFGGRFVLTAVVTAWSVFTGLTAAAWNFASLLVIRFLFGAGEAGAFPGMARVVYSWIPVKERGLVKGINFSGSRIGAALAMPGVAWLIHQIGWHKAFLVLMVVGFAWAAFWWLWFRDEPAQHKTISKTGTRFHPRQPSGRQREQCEARTVARGQDVRLRQSLADDGAILRQQLHLLLQPHLALSLREDEIQSHRCGRGVLRDDAAARRRGGQRLFRLARRFSLQARPGFALAENSRPSPALRSPRSAW